MKRTLLNAAKTLLPYSIRLNLRKLNWRRLYLQKSLINSLTGNLPVKEVYCPVSEREYDFFIRIKNDNVSPVGGANPVIVYCGYT